MKKVRDRREEVADIEALISLLETGNVVVVDRWFVEQLGPDVIRESSATNLRYAIWFPTLFGTRND